MIAGQVRRHDVGRPRIRQLLQISAAARFGGSAPTDYGAINCTLFPHLAEKP
jgi:hypothetical protein